MATPAIKARRDPRVRSSRTPRLDSLLNNQHRLIPAGTLQTAEPTRRNPQRLARSQNKNNVLGYQNSIRSNNITLPPTQIDYSFRLSTTPVPSAARRHVLPFSLHQLPENGPHSSDRAPEDHFSDPLQYQASIAADITAHPSAHDPGFHYPPHQFLDFEGHSTPYFVPASSAHLHPNTTPHLTSDEPYPLAISSTEDRAREVVGPVALSGGRGRVRSGGFGAAGAYDREPFAPGGGARSLRKKRAVQRTGSPDDTSEHDFQQQQIPIVSTPPTGQHHPAPPPRRPRLTETARYEALSPSDKEAELEDLWHQDRAEFTCRPPPTSDLTGIQTGRWMVLYEQLLDHTTPPDPKDPLKIRPRRELRDLVVRFNNPLPVFGPAPAPVSAPVSLPTVM